MTSIKMILDSLIKKKNNYYSKLIKSQATLKYVPTIVANAITNATYKRGTLKNANVQLIINAKIFVRSAKVRICVDFILVIKEVTIATIALIYVIYLVL